MSETYTVNPAYTTHYGNVIITNSSMTGAGTGTNWSSVTLDPYYSKQPKVNITDKDIVLDGLSLRDFMQSVNERMAIVQPNPALEKEFDELRACADRYRELERKLLEQKRMWETLKKQDT
jgi:hypothetical protein